MGGFDIRQWGLLRLHYWHDIDAALSARGHDVLVTRVHPTAGVVRRAGELKQQILHHLDAPGRTRQRVVILGHSMGGMDARYMVSHLGMARHVSALVTLSTGHRGSPYYDWVVRALGLASPLLAPRPWRPWDLQALLDATTERCAELNRQTPDDPSVRYFSVSAACPATHLPPVLLPGHAIVSAAQGANDGRVSVQSAQWGEHLGTWPVNHFHIVNWPIAKMPWDPTRDVIPYYHDLLDRLTRGGLFPGMHASDGRTAAVRNVVAGGRNRSSRPGASPVLSRDARSRGQKRR